MDIKTGKSRLPTTRRDAMLRVFSLTGFNVIFAAKKVFESRIIVGANGIRPPMIQKHFPIRGTMAFFLRVTGVFAS
jgi:hypothetical protein